MDTGLNAITDVAQTAARRAGEHLLKQFGTIDTVEQKPDRSFVTNLDKEAEALIVAEIHNVFPSHDILAEERGSVRSGAGESDYLWIIDPLDGTHNYMRGVRIFGVSIGIRYQGAFWGGVIYMPVDDEMYVAQSGCGAFKNGKRISVSPVQDLSACSVSYDSMLVDPTGIRIRVMDAVAQRVFNMRMFGASSRILTYLAEGKLDAAVEFDDKPWDFAAGVCLVREAGGVVSAPDGAELGIADSGYVAANRVMHPRFVELVASQLARKPES